jgi:hypothetical protein
MADLATVSDVVARWRPLSTAEVNLATILVGDASRMIRRRWSDIDTRIAADPTGIGLDVKIVIAAMVRRSMMNRDDEGVKSKSSTTGPFSESVELTNPNNNLYLSDAEIEMLDVDGFEPPKAMNGWLA